ncbi:S8 family serine peptidase [Actinomycetota bacterium Odt1-20B]
MSRSPVGRSVRLVVSVGLAFALLPAGHGVARTGGGEARPVRADARTVTLVTGDRVTVTPLGGGKQTVTVRRPDGAGGAVRSQVAGGHVTVVPDEARPYLRAGVLDRRLFDVTELIRQGLGEPGAALPLVVTYTKRLRDAAVPAGARKVRALPSIGALAVETKAVETKGAETKGARGEGGFWRSLVGETGNSSYGTGSSRFHGGVRKVWLDGRVRADMEQSNAQIGSPKAWQAGLTGKGVKVAVLDTGVDVSHPDLKDRVGETKSFIPGQDVADRHGHGTHVTSTVGGSGAASDGKEKGVAPGATLAVGKVLDDSGNGSESEIIAGMEWAAKDVRAKVVSMSLGSREPSDGADPMAAAVNSLSKETGALFVVAAGNSGAPSSIGSPGAADAALTVAAVDSGDRAADFSSQGPRIGDQALKPDLSAPGVDILAARSQLTGGEGYYTSMSGTSMATPHIAGAAALLAERHPDWSGARLKDALLSSSTQLDASAYVVGAGRVSAGDAVDAQVTATGSLDLGFYRWPYDSNRPVRRSLAYTNSADSDVELSLAVEGGGEGGGALADRTLTVPAHGTATTTVTGDGAKAAVGNNSGRIVATSGGKEVAHTAFGLVKEDERYTLTVHVKDRAGAATAADLVVQQLADGTEPFPVSAGDSGTVELRLKPGTYALSSFLDVRGAGGKDSLGLGFLAAPEITLDRDRDVTLDGRKLRRVVADVGRRTETRQLVMEYDRAANGADLQGAVQVPLTYDSVFAAPTRKVTRGSFAYRTVWRLGQPQLAVRGLEEAVPQPGGTLTAGRTKLALVDAGGGAPADYAGKDVRGKAVVVRRTRGGATPAELARAAQEAGAKALYVTDDVPGRLMAWFGTDDNADRPLQIATVDAADGARLIAAARAGRTVESTGTPYTPYVYDLAKSYTGAVPERDLAYRPGKRELAVLDAEFHAAKPVAGGEFRYAISDAFPVGLGFLEKIAYPVRRTEYVSTGGGTRWHESAQAGPTSLEQRSGLVAYRGGRRGELDWFRPVWHPWLGTGLGWGQTRTGNDLEFNVPGWGDSGPDHTGFGDVWDEGSGMTQFSEVYADGKLVDRRKGSGVYAWDADPAERTYKVVTDTSLAPAVWGRATKGHTEWTFRSKETPADRRTYLPLLNLGFDVHTDLTGAVRGGRTVPVGIFAEYVKGAVDTGSIGGGRLEVSYDDGKTWSPAELRREGQKPSWKGELKVPSGASSVSLRASVADDRGGAVVQEIVGAVGVK